MYVITHITLQDLQGNEDDYEVGADVDFECTYDIDGDRYPTKYFVGEPEFSAPGCTLKESRLAQNPQSGAVFPAGWSDVVADALLEAYLEDE